MKHNRIIAMALAGLVVCSLGAPGAAAQQAETEPSLVVDLDESGDADLTLTMTFDLEDDDEAAAFESLRNDEDARTDSLDRFAADVQSVADRADREMEVTGEQVTVERDGDTGVVTLTVHWTNLAVMDDEDVIVTEPFTSGFESDRPFTLVAPDGYVVADASPTPDDDAGESVTWATGTDFDGFEVVLEPDEGSVEEDTEAGSTDTGDDSLPGFGIVSGLVAALVGIALATRLRH